MSISVFVAREAGSGPVDAHCFCGRSAKSIRFFAWVERTLFSTPYYPNRIAVSPLPPAFVRLGDEASPIVLASMTNDASTAARMNAPAASDGWQGPILLPDRRDASTPAQRLFYGSLTGQTRTIPFDTERDSFQLGSSTSDPIVPLLSAAQFEPSTWILRSAATHGKSKTIRRTPATSSPASPTGGCSHERLRREFWADTPAASSYLELLHHDDR